MRPLLLQGICFTVRKTGPEQMSWHMTSMSDLEVLLASTLDGTALSKEFQLEAPTPWPENARMWVSLPLGNTGLSVPGPYPVADRARE